MAKKAGGYENFYNSKTLKIIEINEDHDHLINLEALKIVVPEIRKFIDEND